MRKLRIAQLARPWLPVPPEKYGGAERIVSWLSDGLVRRGHDVTLFASGDSKTAAKLEALFPRSLRNEEVPWTEALLPLLHVLHAIERAHNFDIIHQHDPYLPLFFTPFIKTPVVTTIHGELPAASDITKRGEHETLLRFKEQPVVSISNAQRSIPELHYAATIYNGIPVAAFPFEGKPQPYAAFTGRMIAKKGVLEAIEAAKRASLPLKIATKIDYGETAFYEQEVKGRIDGTFIEYLGELSYEEIKNLLKNAKVLLFPINWEEPFGLAMIEAMACGTPVIAFRRGSVPEIVVDGVTGFIVDTVNEMAEAMKKIDRIDRAACRKHVEKHFSVEKMINEYENIYEKIIKN